MRRANSSASCAGGSGDVRTPSPDWLIATPYLSVVCSFATSSARNVVCVCLTFPATFGSAEARFTKRSYAKNVRKTKLKNKFVFTKRNFRKFCAGYDEILRQLRSCLTHFLRSNQHGRQRRGRDDPRTFIFLRALLTRPDFKQQEKSKKYLKQTTTNKNAGSTNTREKLQRPRFHRTRPSELGS
ncbi:hypothetical protein ISCGN_020653 [Ixodes scapularis]